MIMSPDRPNENFSLEQELGIHAICVRFEKQCQAGEKPAIEHYLAETGKPDRSKLLRELLLIELEQKCHAGDTAREQYVARFPEHRQTIDEVFRLHSQTQAGQRLGDEEDRVKTVTGPSELPEKIDRYRIEKILGMGGFGLVYLARDEQLNRLVAVKVPHAKLVSQPEDTEAYLTEARTVANLDHPHIVPVYDVGSTGEFPCYVVSKYVEGTDLAAKIKEHRPSYIEAAEVVATVAEALHYAHKHSRQTI